MRIHPVAPHEIGPAETAVWQALRAGDPALRTPFLSPAWTRIVARHRPDVRVAVFEDATGRPLGFFPVQRPSRWSAMPVGAPLCDYQGLIGAADLDFDPVALARALGVGRIDFTHLIPAQAALAKAVRARDHSWVATLDGCDDAYVAAKRATGSQSLKKIEQKARRWVRETGLELSTDCHSRDPELFERLLWLKADQCRRTGQIDPLGQRWSAGVVRDTFASDDPDLRGALFVLRHGGRPVAYNYALASGDVMHDWLMAHEAINDRFSPGLILVREALRCAAASGVREMDFGPGPYQHKAALATGQRPIARGFVGRPGLSSAVRGAFYGVRDLCERAAPAPIAALPGKVMRRLDVWRGLSSA